MTTKPLLAETIDIESIPTAGYVVRIEANPSERAAIAKQYHLVEVRSLVADLTMGREADRSIVVEGRVQAEIVQNCVVSLEPVAQSIDEAIRTHYVGADQRSVPAPRPGAEVHLDLNAEPPDILADAELDLGALVLEHFALGIDPYPRAPGAELPGAFVEPAKAAGDSPFAVLAKLTGGK
jgi:uncharacterized metal-binding protein YceD (DUF177 family)